MLLSDVQDLVIIFTGSLRTMCYTIRIGLPPSGWTHALDSKPTGQILVYCEKRRERSCGTLTTDSNLFPSLYFGAIAMDGVNTAVCSYTASVMHAFVESYVSRVGTPVLWLFSLDWRIPVADKPYWIVQCHVIRPMRMLENISPRFIRRTVCSNKHNITRFIGHRAV